MAKEKDEKDEKKVDEIPWTPDKPLADEDDETETQRHARAEARKAYLIGEYTKAPEKDRKKKDGSRRSLW